MSKIFSCSNLRFIIQKVIFSHFKPTRSPSHKNNLHLPKTNRNPAPGGGEGQGKRRGGVGLALPVNSHSRQIVPFPFRPTPGQRCTLAKCPTNEPHFLKAHLQQIGRRFKILQGHQKWRYKQSKSNNGVRYIFILIHRSIELQQLF